MKKVILLISLIFVNACSGMLPSTEGKKNAIKIYNYDLQKGMTDEEVVKLFGKESQYWYSGNKSFKKYYYKKSSYDWKAWMPFSQLYTTEADINSYIHDYEVVLEFDKNNRLINYSKFYDYLKKVKYCSDCISRIDE